MNILITWARSYVAWSLMKLAIKQERLVVFIWDSDKKALSFKSKFYYKNVLFPSPRFEFEKFKQFMITYVNENGIRIIYPTCEEVFYFSMIKSDLYKIWCEVFSDDFNKLKILHSKYKFNKLLNNYKVLWPETQIIHAKSDLNNFKNISKKYIFKYEYSRFASNIYANFKSWFQLIDKIWDFEWRLLAQEFIEWKEVCSFWVAQNWKLRGNIVYENILSYKWWAWTYFKSIVQKDIDLFVANFVTENNFNWFISFDFIINNVWIYAIECNPRPVSGLHLFDDDTGLSNIIFNNKEYDTFFVSRESHKSFVLTNLCFNFWKIFQDLRAFNIKYDVLKAEKSLFFYQIYLIFYYLYIALIQSKKISEVSTWDIEYNG